MRVFDEAGTRIDFVRDDDFTAPGRLLFPGAPDLADRAFDLVVGSFVLRTPDVVAVVDLGIGEGKHRPNRPGWHERAGTGFLDRLGIAREDVRLVLLTHLHADHVGWGTLADGRPTFPNARHVVSRIELDGTRERTRAAADPGTVAHGSFADSIEPLIAAGLVDAVAMDAEIAPGVRFVPAPGHTPGQVVIRAGRAVIAADVLHHPIQLDRPNLVSGFCADGPGAVATRAALIATARSDGLVLVPSHAPPIDFARTRP